MVSLELEDKDKAIEIMKAAMEKEKKMQEASEETKEDSMDNETPNEVETDAADNTETVSDEIVTEEIEKAAEDEMEEADSEDTDTKQKKGNKFFKSSKSKELSAKDQKIGELSDRVMRTIAEFDNFRKRSEKEKSQMFDLGAKNVIEKLLPIIDNFERGLSAISEEEKESAFAKGIELIYKQLITALEEIGVKPIDAVGKEFDPNLHNAVMHGEDETLGANIVSDEFQKGYLYHDIVVRHSMVKVVN